MLKTMKSRRRVREEQKLGAYDSALARFRSMTLEQQQPATIADNVSGKCHEARRIPCLWFESVSTFYSDDPRTPQVVRYTSTYQQASVEDEIENRSPLEPHKTVTVTKQDNVLLLPAPSRPQQNQKSATVSAVSSRNGTSKDTRSRKKMSTTSHFKVSKPGADRFGRILRDRQCYWANKVTLETMLASVTESSKDDLDQALTERRKASLPETTRRRSRSLASCEGRQEDNLTNVKGEGTDETKLNNQFPYWFIHTPYSFDRPLSPSIGDCTPLMNDENMDTPMEKILEMQKWDAMEE